jgi:hypothetical protein
MSFPARIDNHGALQPRARVALAYSTKDRVELSKQTSQPFREVANCDLYWMDGSTTEEGCALPAQLAPSIPALKEIHHGVTGGPDIAIVYSLTYLLQRGYDYIGLVENDVLLEAGWLERLMDLFTEGESDGLRVGAVSARTIRERALVRHGDYAVMFNLGAGMVLFSRQAARAVLDRYHTPTVQEIRETVRSRTGLDIARNGIVPAGTCADWFYDAGLLWDGFCSLAPVPALADNVDAPFGCRLVRNYGDLPEDPAAFEVFRHNHQKSFESPPKQAGGRLSGKRIVFPHQVVAAVPNAADANWSLVWRQTVGPFAFVSRAPGATLRLPLFGSPAGLILEGGPQAGEIEIEVAAEKVPFSLRRERSELIAVEYSPSTSNGTPVCVKALTPGVVWCGLLLAEDYFLFPYERSFDFGVICPFVEQQPGNR